MPGIYAALSASVQLLEATKPLEKKARPNGLSSACLLFKRVVSPKCQFECVFVERLSDGKHPLDVWSNWKKGICALLTMGVYDILIGMGQSIADINNLWRRRCERKIQFLKMSMVGMDNRYKWTAYQGVLNGRGEIGFTQIKAGTRKYDPQYFGSYASHTGDTTNTDTYADDRLNIFKTPFFKYGVPVALVAGVLAINYIMGFFSPQETTIKNGVPVTAPVVHAPSTAYAYQRPVAPENVAPPVIETTSVNGAGDLDTLFDDGYTIVLSANFVTKEGETQYFELHDENHDALLVFDQNQAKHMGLDVSKVFDGIWVGKTETGAMVALTEVLDKPMNGRAIHATRIETQ